MLRRVSWSAIAEKRQCPSGFICVPAQLVRKTCRRAAHFVDLNAELVAGLFY